MMASARKEPEDLPVLAHGERVSEVQHHLAALVLERAGVELPLDTPFEPPLCGARTTKMAPEQEAEMHLRTAVGAIRAAIKACPSIDKKLTLTAMLCDLRDFIEQP